MIYIPKKDSLRDRICQFIADNGPVPMREIGAAFSSHRYDIVKDAVFQLSAYNALVREDSIYQLAPMVRRHYEQCEVVEAKEEAPAQIVQPRSAPEFRPLSSKHMAHLAPRREPIRDVGFLNGSIGFSAGYQV